MRFTFSTLLLLAPGLFAAEEPQRSGTPRTLIPGKPIMEEDSSSQPIPAISLLPEGSILEKVMLPRYDKNRKLASVLRCEEMTLVTTDLISGKTVSIESFNPDRTPKAKIDLATALFDQKKNLLKADGAVALASDRFNAEGTGLVYALDQQRGFLKGPVTTTIIQAPATAMNRTSPAIRATALFSASFLPLVAAPPTVAPEELAKIEQAAAPMAGKAAEANKEARTGLRAALEASEAANKATLEFLDQADLLAANSNASDTPVPEAKPLELPVDPTQTKIDSKGLYFDSPNNVVVFLKDIVVNDPGYHLTAANELKIFFDKKAPAKAAKKEAEAVDPATPADSKKTEKKNSLSFGGGNFGDPRTIIATGAVRVLQKNAPAGKQAAEASGAMFHYDLATGTVTVSGGFPWFRQGTTALRAGKAGAWIRIDKNYNISSDPNGQWTVIGSLKDAQNQKDPKGR